uniref:Uncharacterized protein n=1 Tax=Caenorhabditis tropicalis TaxID=1561998 RepID=A0A1I7UH33_9PELO
MSTEPVYIVLSSDDTVKYAIDQTLFSIESGIRGAPSDPFYPDEIQDQSLSLNISCAVSFYEGLAKNEGDRTQKTLERLTKEGKTAQVNSVLYDFNQNLFGIVEKAKKEGIRLKEQYDGKEDYCRIKELEEELAEKDEKLERLFSTIDRYKTKQSESNRMLKEKDEEIKRLSGLIREMDQKLILEEKEKKESVEKWMKKFLDTQYELLKSVHRHKTDTEEWNLKEFQFNQRIEYTDEYAKRLKELLEEAEERNMEDENLMMKLDSAEEEVYDLNCSIDGFKKIVETLTENLEKLTKELGEKKKKEELKEATDELPDIYEDDELDMESFDQLEDEDE